MTLQLINARPILLLLLLGFVSPMSSIQSGSSTATLGDLEIEKPPAQYKSKVWEYFGFPVTYKNGNRKVNRDVSVCRSCHAQIRYTGNTTNMSTHISRHHALYLNLPNQHARPSSSRLSSADSNPTNNINTSSQVNTSNMTFVSLVETNEGTGQKKQTKVEGVGQLRMQTFLQNSTPLPPGSARSHAITRSIGLFMAHDMRPYSVVENVGFRKMVHTLEPRYNIPSRTYFATNTVPKLYSEAKEKLEESLKEAKSLSITTDGWTSRSANSFITVTVHFIDKQWAIQNYVLQTRVFNMSHTASNLSTILLSAVNEWSLFREGLSIPVTSDNAQNIVNAVRDSEGLGPNIRCFAHTINLASQKGIGVPAVNQLLGKVRKLITYFHHSPLGSNVLRLKQEILDIPQHKLIIDVTTRWNSSFDMLTRYREQHEAVFLASLDLKKSKKDLVVLNNDEINYVEQILEVMEPLKTVTTILCTENIPTVSIILPMKTKIINSMLVNETDSLMVKELKTTIADNLDPRYREPGVLQFLEECTALDPRFKIIQNFDEDGIYARISDKCLDLSHNNKDNQDDIDLSLFEEPVKKKTAIENLLCDIVETEVDEQSSYNYITEEIKVYKSLPKAPLSSNPLQWWKSNADRLPNLAQLAKIHLCVPGTSVPSERVFSTAGDIVSAQRNSLSNDNVDTLIFLKKNVSLLE